MKNSSLASRIIYLANKRACLRRIARLVLRYVFSCDVALPVKWGGGNVLEHNGLGVVVSRLAIIGNNCRIYQHVTIGAGKGGYPIIGNNVTIYANSVVVGNIRIGDNCIIGANSFVNVDVPDNSVYAGAPAKFIRSIV